MLTLSAMQFTVVRITHTGAEWRIVCICGALASIQRLSWYSKQSKYNSDAMREGCEYGSSAHKL